MRPEFINSVSFPIRCQMRMAELSEFLDGYTRQFNEDLKFFISNEMAAPVAHPQKDLASDIASDSGDSSVN